MFGLTGNTLLVLALSLVCGLAPSVAFCQGSSTAPYQVLDNTLRDFTNVGEPEPSRPLVVLPHPEDPSKPFFFALNTFASQLLRFTDHSGQPDLVVPLPQFPVAMEYVQGAPANPDDDRLLIACKGSHVLASVRAQGAAAGSVEQIVPLPSGPSDVVVDEDAGSAYVACDRAGVVAQVDLGGATPWAVTHWPLPEGKHPRFLYLDSRDGSVYVTPLISGNNTTVVAKTPEASTVLTEQVHDLSQEQGGGLRDHDVFRLVPGDTSLRAVYRGVGSFLFAHGRNPVSDEHWCLAIEPLNHDLNLQNEPALQGQFAFNQLTVLPPVVPGIVQTAVGQDKLDLDDHLGNGYDGVHTAATPYGLTFTPEGDGLISAVASDAVLALDRNRNKLFHLLLPDGFRPRAVALAARYGEAPEQRSIFVLGHSGVQQYYVGPPSGGVPLSLLATFELGLDPTPSDVAAGRQIFWDASFSASNRFTCGTCHHAGLTDHLPWNLSNLPKDNKGPLITQTLMSIADLFPYHWRGERNLKEFHPAFEGLLGAEPGGSHPPPTDRQFASFQRFIFSLREPANPHQDLSRQLVGPDTGAMPNGKFGDAVDGQQDFLNVQSPTIGQSCADCHQLPIGTDADVTADHRDIVPARTNFMVTGLFNGNITLKEQGDLADFQTVEYKGFGGTDVSITRPPLGSGILHDGLQLTMFDFVNSNFGFDTSDPNHPQIVANIVSFVGQIDTGISAAAHYGRLWSEVSNGNALAVHQEIDLKLRWQAEAAVPGIGLVLYAADGSGPRYHYLELSPGLWRFVPDTRTGSPRSLAFFLEEVLTAGKEYVVLGVPPGNEATFGVDFDNDMLLNGDEATFLTSPYVADCDGDGFPDGYEVLHNGDPIDAATVPTNDSTPPSFVRPPTVIWANSKSAKLVWQSDELATYKVTYTTAAGGTKSVRRRVAARSQSVTLRDLLQSASNEVPPIQHAYSVTVKLTDLSGNSTTALVDPSGQGGPSFVTETGCQGGTFKIGAAEFLTLAKAPSAGIVNVEARFRVDTTEIEPSAAPQTNKGVFYGVYVRGANDQTFQAHDLLTDLNVPPFPLGFHGTTAFGLVLYSLTNGEVKAGIDPSCHSDPSDPNCNADLLVLGSLTGTDGWSNLKVRVSGLQHGDEVSIVPLGILDIDPSTENWPGMPGFTAPAVIDSINDKNPYVLFSLPDTPTALRELSFTFLSTFP
jgi:hypothetical protein